MSTYGFNVQMDCGFDEAVDRVTTGLQQEGFGVLSDIDVQATMKKKLDIDRLPYRILGACNPPLAHQALSADPDIGLLLPCNVVVRQEEDGKVTVAFMDPTAVLQLVDREDIAEIAGTVRGKLLHVRDALEQT